jgi:hypothetical protein
MALEAGQLTVFRAVDGHRKLPVRAQALGSLSAAHSLTSRTSRRGTDLVLHHNQGEIPARLADERSATKAVVKSGPILTIARATHRS